jgi:hypothetical protein
MSRSAQRQSTSIGEADKHDGGFYCKIVAVSAFAASLPRPHSRLLERGFRAASHVLGRFLRRGRAAMARSSAPAVAINTKLQRGFKAPVGGCRRNAAGGVSRGVREAAGPSRGPSVSESHITSEHLRAAHVPEMTSDHAQFLLRAQYRPYNESPANRGVFVSLGRPMTPI